MLNTLLRTARPLGQRRPRKNSKKNKRSRRPLNGFESLETRVVLSASGLNSDIDAVPAVVASADAGHAATVTPRASTRIVNGDPTSGFQSVGIVNNGCTGTLISPTHVLTAAHCTAGVGDRQGSFEVNGQTYGTVDITNHPQYNDNRFDVGYDLAIMELSRPVPGVTPSQILRVAPQVGQTLTLVGFGESGTSTGGSNFDFGNKHVGTTPIDEVSGLHIAWNFDSHNESNTAPGDSGGPAFVNIGGQLYVAGITSGGSGDPHRLGDYSFDTRVDVFANWIDSIVGNANPNPDPDPNPNPDPDPDPNPDPGPGPDDHIDQPAPGATPIILDGNGAGFGQGTLELSGDRDVFAVNVGESGTATVTAFSQDGDLDTYLRVYDIDGNLIAENDDFGGSLDSQVTRSLSAGTYYVSVGSYADAEAGAFGVGVQFDADDAGGDPFGDATEVTLNRNGLARVNGSIRSGNQSRIYAVDAVVDGRLAITARGRSGNLDTMITVYDANGNEVAFNDDWRGTDSRVRIRGVRAGERYFVEVSSYGDTTGNYRLVFNNKAPRNQPFAAVSPNSPAVNRPVETPLRQVTATGTMQQQRLAVAARTMTSPFASSDDSDVVRSRRAVDRVMAAESDWLATLIS